MCICNIKLFFIIVVMSATNGPVRMAKPVLFYMLMPVLFLASLAFWKIHSSSSSTVMPEFSTSETSYLEEHVTLKQDYLPLEEHVVVCKTSFNSQVTC